MAIQGSRLRWLAPPRLSCRDHYVRAGQYERRKIIEHFGAKLILFEASGYLHGIEMSQQTGAREFELLLAATV